MNNEIKTDFFEQSNDAFKALKDINKYAEKRGHNPITEATDEELRQIQRQKELIYSALVLAQNNCHFESHLVDEYQILIKNLNYVK